MIRLTYIKLDTELRKEASLNVKEDEVSLDVLPESLSPTQMKGYSSHLSTGVSAPLNA